MTDKITLTLTLDELKLIDKYVELNDETQSVFDKIKYAYPQPTMTLESEGDYAVVSYNDRTYYRLMGETTFSWYIKKGVSANHPVPTLVMVDDAETERLLEGIYYNHIEVKKQKEPEENEWKLVALRLGEKLSDNGPGGYYDFTPGEWLEWALNECKKEPQKWDAVRESVKWCEENPDKDPLDWLKPQTPEQVADGLKEAFREAVKQGVVSSVDKPKDDFMDRMVEELKGQTLRDVCMDWWDRVFGDTDDTETCIDNLVDEITLWLPKYQSAAGSQNAYVESAVEGFNDCLDKIKNKLR